MTKELEDTFRLKFYEYFYKRMTKHFFGIEEEFDAEEFDYVSKNIDQFISKEENEFLDNLIKYNFEDEYPFELEVEFYLEGEEWKARLKI